MKLIKFLVLLCTGFLLFLVKANASEYAQSSSALILIEYQNEWVSPKGNLRNLLVEDKQAFSEAIEQSKTLLKAARKKGVHIIHVTLAPDATYKVFGQAKFGLRAVIPKVKTWQGEMQNIHPDFLPQFSEYVITQRTGASAFAGSSLDSYLRNNKIDTLYLAGFATHVCVESTLREAHDKGYNTYVVTDATGAFNNSQQRYFEQHILHHFGEGITVSSFNNIL